MTNLFDWQQQSGGLLLRVSPFDGINPKQRDAAISVVRDVVQTVAQSHGAAFNENGFQNNIQALDRGDLMVSLYEAKWEVCNKKPIYLGAALGWETYGFTTEGELARSFYTEEVCILKNAMRQVVLAKPAGKEYPNESLAECLERIYLAQMSAQGITYRFGEVNGDNTTMMRQLGSNKANMGSLSDSAVLEYRQLPNTLMNGLPMDVNIHPIKKNGVNSKRHFLTTYSENGHDLRFIATIGQATSLGQRRVDLRAWHNGNVPKPTVLEDVISSTLLAIKRKIEEPKAGTDFGKPMPETHIFVQKDGHLLQGFGASGASQRLFGNKPMIPGVNILQFPKLAA